MFLNQPIIGLSPMDGITDEPFRLLQTQIAKPDLIFTEFVSAEGLARGGVRLYEHLLYKPEERPIIAQLFGKDPDSFYLSALILCHLGFDGVDINMGCPAKTVTAHGSGAALIDKPQLAAEIIAAVKSALSDYVSASRSLVDLKLKEKVLSTIVSNQKYTGVIPKIVPTLSVKTRIGINSIVTPDWISHLLGQGLDFISLHGRTLKQGYSGLAHWDQIKIAADLAHQAHIRLLGNGDITSRRQGQQYIDKYRVDGVLIGRAALGNPWVFSDQTPTIGQKFTTMAYQAQISQTIFPHRRFDSLRRHFLAYAAGLPHAKKLRSKLVQVSTLEQLFSLEPDFVNC